MAGSGVEIGKDVLVLYNDPSPHTVRSLGYTSKSNQASDWIIPGYYYLPCKFIVFACLFSARILGLCPSCVGTHTIDYYLLTIGYFHLRVN